MIADYQKEIGQKINEKVQAVFINAPSTLKRAIQREDNKCFLYMPRLVITYWQTYLQEELKRTFFQGMNTFKYRNIVVLPGYETKIVLFHEDNMLRVENDLISEEKISFIDQRENRTVHF